jgi:hypothetical protein
VTCSSKKWLCMLINNKVVNAFKRQIFQNRTAPKMKIFCDNEEKFVKMKQYPPFLSILSAFTS